MHSVAFQVRLEFHGDLVFFLSRSAHLNGVVVRDLKERTSVKDVIEACGVPHPEIDAIQVDERFIEFSYIIDKNSHISIYSVDFTLLRPPSARLQTQFADRFVADVHLAALSRNLRLLGFDCASCPDGDDRDLLDVMQTENRALLTRDRCLLMHGAVKTGFYPRSQNPEEQTVEVLRRFHLAEALRPFSRCLSCNTRPENSSKEDVLPQLEPLTRIYYEQFRRCPGCGRIYWRGSHFQKLEQRVAEFRAKLRPHST